MISDNEEEVKKTLKESVDVLENEEEVEKV